MFSPSPFKLFCVQLFSWISILILLMFSTWPWILAALLVYVVYGGLGVALTFHRILSHGSFTVSPLMRKIIITLASFANVGSPITWVAVHRAHHRYCDTVKDPHSPLHNSFWYMMFGTMYSKVKVKFAVDLLRDPFCQFIHNYYFLIQVPWICILFYLGGWEAVIALHFIPGGLTWLGGSLVNYLNHRFGYQHYSGIKDSSSNNFITGFLVFGEGWHNNHHANPTKSTTKEKWWEFDLLYWIGCSIGTPRKK